MPHPWVLFGVLVFVLVILLLAALPGDSLGAGEAYSEDEPEDDTE